MLNLLNDSAVLQVTLHFALKLLKKPTEKWWTGEKRWSFLQKCPYQRRPKTLFSGKNPLSAPVFLCSIITGCVCGCVFCQSWSYAARNYISSQRDQRFRLFRLFRLFLSRKNLWFGGKKDHECFVRWRLIQTSVNLHEMGGELPPGCLLMLFMPTFFDSVSNRMDFNDVSRI